MVRQRHPNVADSIIMSLERDALCFRAVRDCEGHLRAAGFEPRLWEDIAQGARPWDSAEDEPLLHKKLAKGSSVPSRAAVPRFHRGAHPLRVGASSMAFSPGTSGIHRLRGHPHQ